MDRRTFLLHTSAGLIAHSLKWMPMPRQARQKRVRLSARIPRLIFFPECQASSDHTFYCASKQVNITEMEIDDGAIQDSKESQLRLYFSNGQKVLFDRNVSFFSKSVNSGVDRDAVVIKSFVSWSLDHISNLIRYSKTISNHETLRNNFYQFQEQDNLESINIGAIFDLIVDLERKDKITRVLWERKQLRFVVE